MVSQQPRRTVTFEELAHSNMLKLNALVELLDERGIVAKREVLDRVKKLGLRPRPSEVLSDVVVSGGQREQAEPGQDSYQT